MRKLPSFPSQPRVSRNEKQVLPPSLRRDWPPSLSVTSNPDYPETRTSSVPVELSKDPTHSTSTCSLSLPLWPPLPPLNSLPQQFYNPRPSQPPSHGLSNSSTSITTAQRLITQAHPNLPTRAGLTLTLLLSSRTHPPRVGYPRPASTAQPRPVQEYETKMLSPSPEENNLPRI